MALFVLLGVLRGFPAAAYRRTPHRKPLCGLDQNKNCSFLNWTPVVFILDSWMDTSSLLHIFQGRDAQVFVHFRKIQTNAFSFNKHTN
jgi:hypothetical protein